MYLRPLATLAMLAIVLPYGVPSHAQSFDGFRVDRFFAPPTAEDGLVLALPSTLDAGRWSIGVVGDYARHSLSVQRPVSGTEAPYVRNRWGGQLVAAYGLTDRLELHARAPIVLSQRGGTLDAAGDLRARAVGDVSLGASAHLLGSRRRGLQLGLFTEVFLPTGQRATLTSDDSLAPRGGLSLAYVVPRGVTLAAQLGAMYRPKLEFGGHRIGTEMFGGLGVYVPLRRNWQVMLELQGHKDFRKGRREGRRWTVQPTLGTRVSLASTVHVQLGVGVDGPPATGAPEMRGVLGLLVQPAAREMPLDLPTTGGMPPEREIADAESDAADEFEAAPVQSELVETAVQASEPVEPEPEVAEPEPAPVDPAPEVAEPVEPEPTSWVESIPFVPGGARFEAAALPTLAALRERLMARPQRRLRVQVYTVGPGSEARHRILSQARADAIRGWLVAHGVEAQRVESVGMGKRSLQGLEPSSDPYAHERVELELLE